MTEIIKTEDTQRELTKELVALQRESNKTENEMLEVLKRIDERQALENHSNKRLAIFTVIIMIVAFYVEIVKIEDFSIIKNRTVELVDSIITTYKEGS